jgi:hypothetical protein
MKKALVVCSVLALWLLAAVLTEPPMTRANSTIDAAFDSRYGSELTSQFGCSVCHSTQSISEFNPYGEDLVEALSGGGGGGCLEYYPPNTHTVSKGRCEYMHAPGLFTPFSSGCTTCHGVDLNGLIAPSCYECHDQRWTENGGASAAAASVSPAQDSVADALEQIEPLDSDGDGYTNLEEINALTNPGDANSFPGGVTKVTVDVDGNWPRSWVLEREYLVVKLRPEEGEIDTRSYVSLKTDDGELFSTSLKRKGKTVEAYFPKALLHNLFSSLNAKSANVVVSGKMASGGTFTGKFKAKLTGAGPELLAGVAIQVKPAKWESGDEIVFTITGSNAGLIDTTQPITAFGVFRRAQLEDVRGQLSRVAGRLNAEDAEKVIGTPVKDVVYNVGLVGSATDGKVFNKLVQINVPVSDCYEFDTPASHTVPFKTGDCTYMHAPGYSEPYANNCSICHGADLRGTSATPSCYLCHSQLWTTSNNNATSASPRE